MLQRIPLFGDVVDGRMRMSAFGRIGADEWRRTERVRDNVALDAFVVMPDPIHGIICITSDASTHIRRVTARRNPTRSKRQFGPTPTPDHCLHHR